MIFVDAQCIPCILHVRAREIANFIRDRRIRVKLISELAALVANEALKDANITKIATLTFRRLKETIENNDPYSRVKREANFLAEKALKDLNSKYLDDIKFLIKLAAIGNSIDFGVLGYEFDAENILNEVKKAIFKIDDTDKLLETLKSVRTIIYLLDNAGEAVFDRELIRAISKNYVNAVTYVVAKSGSFQNDITYGEAKELRFTDIGKNVKLIETGTDASTIFLDEINPELREVVEEADLIISKGMAHYEYLASEDFPLKKNMVFILRAKCSVIASSLNVGLGEYVIKFVRSK